MSEGDWIPGAREHIAHEIRKAEQGDRETGIILNEAERQQLAVIRRWNALTTAQKNERRRKVS